MSPMLKKVEKAGVQAIKGKRQPNKIDGDDFFSDSNTLRHLYSELINNPEPNRIVMIPSVSYGIANAVNNIPLRKGDNVVVAEGQFPSNVYPWKNHCEKHEAILKIVDAPDTEVNRGRKWNDELLHAIDEQTKVVALGNVHWADGTLFHLKEMRAKCDEVGAALIIDGTQSIGALPFDIKEVKPDALIVAGYKWLMGPYTSGLAYYGPRFDQGEPIEQNWINRKNSEDFAGLVNYEDQYQEGALRFEMGERSNFIANPMLLAAIKQLRMWGVDEIQNYCRTITKKPIDEVRDLGLYIEATEARGAHLFGIKFPEEKAGSLNIALKKHKVSVSMRGGYVRVAPHVYNDERDMNRLLRALKSAL